MEAIDAEVTEVEEILRDAEEAAKAEAAKAEEEAEAADAGGGASEASDARVSAANRRRAGDAPGTRRERATIPPRNRWGARRASPPGGRDASARTVGAAARSVARIIGGGVPGRGEAGRDARAGRGGV